MEELEDTCCRNDHSLGKKRLDNVEGRKDSYRENLSETRYVHRDGAIKICVSHIYN